MKNLFIPDHMFGTYREVTPDFLAEIGVNALLIDIDNTLAPYEVDEPDDNIRAWFASLSESGIRCALISNNHSPRVELFNRTLDLDIYPDSHKPCKKSLVAAMEKFGSDKNTTAVLGDQIFTDVFAGKRLGLRAIMVPPIKDKRTLFFRFKRLLEKPFIKAYRRQEEKRGQK